MLNGSATVITPPQPYLHEDVLTSRSNPTLGSVSCGLVALFLCEATIFMTKSCNVIGLHSIEQRHKLQYGRTPDLMSLCNGFGHN